MRAFGCSCASTLTFHSHPVGTNRYGETFLQFLHRASKVDEAELKALALTFAEQSREGESIVVVAGRQASHSTTSIRSRHGAQAAGQEHRYARSCR